MHSKLPVVTEDTIHMTNDFFDMDDPEGLFDTFFVTLQRENPVLALIIKAHIVSPDPKKEANGVGMIALYQMMRVQLIIDEQDGKSLIP